MKSSSNCSARTLEVPEGLSRSDEVDWLTAQYATWRKRAMLSDTEIAAEASMLVGLIVDRLTAIGMEEDDECDRKGKESNVPVIEDSHRVTFSGYVNKQAIERAKELWYRGVGKFKKGQFAEAIKDYNLALYYDPTNPWIIRSRDYCIRELKDQEGRQSKRENSLKYFRSKLKSVVQAYWVGVSSKSIVTRALMVYWTFTFVLILALASYLLISIL